MEPVDTCLPLCPVALEAKLDWDEKKQEEADQEVEADLIAAGRFGDVREGLGLQGGMSRIVDKMVAEKRAYQLTRRNGG